jgi:hypothetical protein
MAVTTCNTCGRTCAGADGRPLADELSVEGPENRHHRRGPHETMREAHGLFLGIAMMRVPLWRAFTDGRELSAAHPLRRQR